MRFPIFLFISVALAISPAFAEEAKDVFASLRCADETKAKEEGKLTEQIEHRYSEIVDLAADFSQESYFPGSGNKQQSGGKVYFVRPGKMDWVYGAPDEQRFTSDGSTVWWYQPETNQVIIRDLKQSFSSDVPVSFLLGVGKLRESFRFQARCNVPRGILVELAPIKSNPNLDQFYLLVDKRDYSPLGARIINLGGTETSIVFNDSKHNTKVDDKHFHFTIPKGTDVIDERGQAQLKEENIE